MRAAPVPDDLVRRFLDERLQAGLAPSTLAQDRRALARLVFWMRARRLAWPDVTPRRVSEYLALIERRRIQRGAHEAHPPARGTVLAEWRSLRVWFRYLVDHDVVLLDPARGVRIRSCRVLCGRGVFREDEVLALLDALATDTLVDMRERTIVSVLYGTGMRIGELVALDLADYDPEEGLLAISCGKGQKGRVVPVGRTVRADLAHYLEHTRPELARRNGAVALFLNTWGTRLSGQRVTQHLKDVQRQLGIRPVRASHALRHAFTTHLLARGADITVLQRFLGHAQLDTTALYTHVELADLRRVLSRHPRERRAP